MARQFHEPRIVARLRDRMRRFELYELDRRARTRPAQPAKFHNTSKKVLRPAVKKALEK